MRIYFDGGTSLDRKNVHAEQIMGLSYVLVTQYPLIELSLLIDQRELRSSILFAVHVVCANGIV
jgi:hypothetical protein